MFKLTGMRSWNFNADNLDQTVRFYQDALGVDQIQQQTVGGVAVARLRIGDSGVGIFDASEGPRPGVPHHTFNFEGPRSSDEMVQELEARGLKVLGVRPHGAGPGYSVYVDDPNGNHIELSTDPA
jgi:predicted enzyme related to lactoylglutathione lyase